MTHTRTLTGTIHKPTGDPWAGFRIDFALTPTAHMSHATLPATVATVTTGEDGAFSVALEVGVQYEARLAGAYLTQGSSVTYPPGTRFKFVLPDGAGAISLEEVVALNAPPDGSGSFASALSSHIASHANPHQVTAAQLADFDAEVTASPSVASHTATLSDHTAELADHEARATAAAAATSRFVATGALRARNRMVVSMGDSIAGTGIQDYGPTSGMWLANACVQLDGKLVWSGVYSEPGYTTAQVRATVLPRLLAADVLPGFCAIMCGANDAYSMATFRSEYGAILDGLLAANIIPIVCALVPNDTSGNHVKIHAYNTWLARECGRRGLVFVNWIGALVDPATAGNWNPGNSDDGTHPNATGGQLMADVFAETMELYFAAGVTVDPYLALCNLDPTTLQLANSDPRNCLMLTDTGSNGSADGWAIVNNGSAASALSIQNPSSSDALGKWQRLTRADNDGSNNSRLWTPVPFSGLSAGDLVSCAFRVKAVIESASPAGTLGAWTLHDGATGPLGTDPRIQYLGSGWAKDIPATTLCQEVVARSGVSVAYLIFDFASGEGYFQIGQFTLRNLTALGID